MIFGSPPRAAPALPLGGGAVESYPEDAQGRSVAGAFLYNATLAMFERRGFERARRLGKHC